MRFFVLGAGRMGEVIAKDLVENSKSRVELGVGDIDVRRAEEIVSGCGKGQAFRVDVSETNALSKLLENYDVVLNATWYELNLLVMRACLNAGCAYNDLGGLFHVTRKQLELNSEVRKRGISAIVGGGESPGITNLMVYFSSQGMTKVHSAKILVGAKETSQSTEIVFPFSPSTVIDEYSKKPVEYIDGKFVELEPLSGEEKVDFAGPVGTNHCHYSIHSETATLPGSLGRGVQNVEFKLGTSEKLLKVLAPLIEMGMTSDATKVRVGDSAISPRDFLVSFFNEKSGKNAEQAERWVAIRTVVEGVKQGARCAITCDLVSGPPPFWNVKNATAFLTGVAASIFGSFLAEGKVLEKGVLPPELAVDAGEFLNELNRRGITIQRSESFMGS